MKRAILLVDHGSRLDEANALLERVAERVRQRAPDTIVACAHMELAPPDVAAGVAACVDAGATEIVVHPYFLGPGRHTTEDIPRLVGAAAKRHPGVEIRVSEPLGVHDGLVQVLLERVESARRS